MRAHVSGHGHAEADAGDAGHSQRASSSTQRADAVLVAGVAVLAFAAYLLTLSRGVLGGDAGELQFVPPILGLTHPTGYPLQVLMHYAWGFVPIGSVAYRLNLLDAVFAAVAVGLVVGLTQQAGVGRTAAALAGLTLAFGELWWSQAVRGDKYTLNGLFLALVLVLFLLWRARPTNRRLAILAFLFGLSLTHHRSMLLVVPALGVGMLLAGWRPTSLRGVVLPIVLCLAPLTLYVYVPWAGGRGLPPGSWPVDTPAAFVEFLLDRGYTSQIRLDAAFNGRLLEEAQVLLRSFGPLGVVLGLLGIGASFSRDWRLGIVLLLTFVPQAVIGASYVLESNYTLPRHWVFYLPAFLIWSVWLGIGLQGVADLLRRVPWRPALLTSAVMATVLLAQAGSAWARGAILLVRAEAGAETMDAWRQDFQRSPVAERFGRLSMDLAAPNAVIVCDWEQATVLWYFQRVEGMRPDLTIRYPIERLDQTLAEARTTGQTVYISRTLPGVESRGVTSSVGPLIRVYAPPGASATVTGSVGTAFEDGLVLVAATQHASGLQAGSVIPFTLIWRAERPIPEAIAVSVRLIGPDGAVLAAQDERHPALGTSPTNTWTPGQLIRDYRELPIASRVAPGRYQIEVVPYRLDPTHNLRKLDADGQPSDDPVRFSVQVAPRTLRRPLDLLASLLTR